MPLLRFVLAAAAMTAIAATIAPASGAQQPTRRRQAPIEIRGQVPTPQVVTVRPREVPAYSRRILVPRFFDHDFWPAIQLGYDVVPERQVSGRAVTDTASDSATVTRRGGTRPDSTVKPVPRPPGSRAAPADSSRRRPGTAPAR